MRAGDLNRRVTLQQRSAGHDALGQPNGTWADLATLWASVRHLSGLQALKADAEVSEVQASIRLRYRTDITAGMRAVLGTTIYDIKAVLPDQAHHEFVDLTCTTGANQG